MKKGEKGKKGRRGVLAIYPKWRAPRRAGPPAGPEARAGKMSFYFVKINVLQ